MTQEGDLLTVRKRKTGEIVGFLILGEHEKPDGAVRLHIGYFLAESDWGQGLGSELVGGLIGWSSDDDRVNELVGITEIANVASAKVLTRNGFEPTDDLSMSPGMVTYRREV